MQQERIRRPLPVCISVKTHNLHPKAFSENWVSEPFGVSKYRDDVVSLAIKVNRLRCMRCLSDPQRTAMAPKSLHSPLTCVRTRSRRATASGSGGVMFVIVGLILVETETSGSRGIVSHASLTKHQLHPLSFSPNLQCPKGRPGWMKICETCCQLSPTVQKVSENLLRARVQRLVFPKYGGRESCDRLSM